MRFGLFYMAEFIQVVVIAGLVTAIFLGGWSVPYLPQQTIIDGVAGFFGVGFATLVCMLLHAVLEGDPAALSREHLRDGARRARRRGALPVNVELALFYAFALLAVLSAVAMVAFVRHIVAGAMSLVVTMISLAGIYVLLRAELVAAIQIMVYAGAILVLFLFVIMLLNLREGGDLGEGASGPNRVKLAAIVGCVGIGALLVARASGLFEVASAPHALPEGFGGYRALGIALYTEYVVAVELAGLILLAAIVGAVILARRRID
jgi:NADH-quinone oxidoreductase subunit J